MRFSPSTNFVRAFQLHCLPKLSLARNKAKHSVIQSHPGPVFTNDPILVPNWSKLIQPVFTYKVSHMIRITFSFVNTDYEPKSSESIYRVTDRVYGIVSEHDMSLTFNQVILLQKTRAYSFIRRCY